MFGNNIGYQQTKEQFLLLTITFCSFGLCSKIVHYQHNLKLTVILEFKSEHVLVFDVATLTYTVTFSKNRNS